MNKLNEGSKWHKWDIHIHTPYTGINNQYKAKGKSNLEIWKAFCEKLNDSKINAFGITDYGSFKNYQELREKRTEYGLNHNIYIFPNLEIRVSGLTPRRTQDNKGHHAKVNIHILLSDKVKNEQLDKLLAGIQVNGPDERKLDLKNDYSEIVSDERFVYVPSYKKVVQTLKDVFGINSDEYLIMVPNNDDGIATNDGTGENNDFTFINDYVDIIQSSNLNDRRFYLKQNNSNNPYKKLFPCVTGSDSHSFNDLDKLSEKKVTWIKSSLSFEGLRSIIYEPESRVVVQQQNPENKILSKQVRMLELPEKDFKKQKIIFNQNLVSVIGSRSSGKSLLLSILAKTMGYKGNIKENNTEYQDLVDSYSKNAVSYYYDKQKANTNINSVDLIYQNQLQSIAVSQNKTNEFVNNILIGQNVLEKNNLDGELKRKNNNLDSIINSLKNEKLSFNELCEQIVKFQKEEKIKENIKGLEEQLDLLMPKFDKEKASNISKRISNNLNLQKQLLDENKMIQELPTQLINDLPINYSDPYFNAAIKELIAKFKEKLNETIEMSITENLNKINNFKIENNKLKGDNDYRVFLQSINNTPQLNQINNVLNNEKSKLIELKKYKAQLEKLKSKIKSLYQELHEHLVVNKEQIKILENDELKFMYNLVFDLDKIKSILRDNLRISRKSYKLNATGILKELDDDSDKDISLNKKIEDFYRTITNIINQNNDSDIFRTSKNIYTLLDDLRATMFFKYDYSILYKNQDFYQMSEGKKAFVLLLLKLKIEKNEMPLLIDQPEDELDNKSIVKDLVQLLKNQKKHRQIILVTHNANIVIGADSEQVIIASEKDGVNSQDEKFNYEGGPLEDKKIKNKICEILEGGESAFKQRENRYNFKV